MTDTTYNGWTNYETWLANVWIDNDQGSQEHWQERAQACVQDAIDADESEPREEAVTALASELEESFGEQMGETFPQAQGLFHDLLTAALGRIEWRELARHMVNEVEIFSAGWNLPGCMPDTPPALFTSNDDARMHLSEQMDTHCDDPDAMPLGERMALEAASLAVLKGSGEYGETVAAWHYFITKV